MPKLISGQCGEGRVLSIGGNDLRLKGEFTYSKALSFWAEAILTGQDSTDLRYAYDRSQIVAGVSWEHRDGEPRRLMPVPSYAVEAGSRESVSAAD